MYFFLGITVTLLASLTVLIELKRKHMILWLPSFFRQMKYRRTVSKMIEEGEDVHVMFLLVDHYEPMWMGVDRQQEDQRVEIWRSQLPESLKHAMDSDGRHPVHTFFYPEEEYRYEHISKLEQLCGAGFAEIEVHIHHENDSRESLEAKLKPFITNLHENHGCFAIHPETGLPAWAFIHGNWALCNSAAHGRNCGVNEELPLLKDLGCYLDLTLPSAPSETQTSKINSIYYAKNIPGQPKSHDTGENVRVDGEMSGDLMLLQGPLGFNWEKRKYWVAPTTESADFSGHAPPTIERIKNWINMGISVEGRPQWIFVKVHTHGAQERNMSTLLGEKRIAFHKFLENYCAEISAKLHYVSAREAYNIIRAAEKGLDGNPHNYRDFVIPRPRNCRLD